MDGEVYRYDFGECMPLRNVEESLLLAALAVECLYGRSQLRLDAAFRLDKERRCCVVDARSEVGRGIARIFTGFLTREFGDEAFKVEKTAESAQTCTAQATAAGGRNETL